MKEKICVIVFTCDRDQDLKRCMDSVFNQSYKDFAVLVIDNGDSSSDEILKNYNLKIIKDKTKRLSYLFNLGWKSADQELLLYLADDVTLSPEWLKEAVATSGRHPEAAVITGPLISPFEYTGEMHSLYVKARKNSLFRIAADLYDRFILEGKIFEPCVLCESGSYTLGQGFIPHFNEEREVDLATTSSMLIRRSAIEKIGGFDEHFIFNHADGDLFVRLKRQGYRIIYNPAIQGTHYVRMGPSRYPYYIGRDTAYFYMKDIRPQSLKGFFVILANILVLNLYWVYKTIESRNAGYLRGISGFFRGVTDYILR